MYVIINGETETCAEAASVADLLQTRGHDPKTVVVEHNGNIVPAAAFAATPLRDGDRLEIVHFVGGG
ncbi:sulfur carrier protein ThiS [uncultured Desulfovibrio sp.]|uniref:sulfur carrier protein ThiS n=1 Tax=uncultured Desulfovibrio sp. TaxID=167968 RepID=UPI0003AAC0D2|nr:sulfur carrier protein ThiS [uncultured Desulfovibrio sp.]